ncbi:SIR2 family NAD-dependent protein deacylase [Candidatus Palauibacter sp.]|uniref:SIR2 family NAD-dependent protein deacylase n=1 Tax=Candidatus Palauibacter sp. TaxID=3101350 RepID=UPI003B59D6E9
MEQGQWREARRLVREARRVVALTGAGISAESGVPTFRDAGGLWRSYRPEELATPEALIRDPRTVLEWYAWRRSRLSRCRPNAGHRALARFFLKRGEAGLVTQNVDGLHTHAALEEAGDAPPDPALPIELHGAVGRDRCNGCETRWPAEPLADSLPRCASCGDLRRPDVVLFGETLDPEVLERARLLAERADLCLVVGTSAVVYPAAALPLATRESGGHIVEVNVRSTALTEAATVALRGEAGTVLPALLD